MLSHIDEHGRARMVDVSEKGDTTREAIAAGEITMKPETLALIAAPVAGTSGMAPSGTAELKKGDVFATAQIAGIMAAKRTSELIPMCHNIPLTGVAVDFDLDHKRGVVGITGRA